MLDAMRHVVAQDFLFHAPERSAHRRNLRDDVDAIAILVDHLREAADLAFDPAQALLQRCLAVFSHRAYIPREGINFKAGAIDEWHRTGTEGQGEDLLRRTSRPWRACRKPGHRARSGLRHGGRSRGVKAPL